MIVAISPLLSRFRLPPVPDDSVYEWALFRTIAPTVLSPLRLTVPAFAAAPVERNRAIVPAPFGMPLLQLPETVHEPPDAPIHSLSTFELPMVSVRAPLFAAKL